jgi:hypothetical protein
MSCFCISKVDVCRMFCTGAEDRWQRKAARGVQQKPKREAPGGLRKTTLRSSDATGATCSSRTRVTGIHMPRLTHFPVQPRPCRAKPCLTPWHCQPRLAAELCCSQCSATKGSAGEVAPKEGAERPHSASRERPDAYCRAARCMCMCRERPTCKGQNDKMGARCGLRRARSAK